MFLLFILFVLVVIFLLFLVLRSLLRYPTFSLPRFFRVFLLRDSLFSSLRFFCATPSFLCHDLFARPPRFFVPRFFSRCPSFFVVCFDSCAFFCLFSAYLVKNRHHIEPPCFCAQYAGLQMFMAAERCLRQQKTSYISPKYIQNFHNLQPLRTKFSA